MVYLRPRENDPFRAVNIYMTILEEESQKLKSKAATMSDEEIMEQILKNRKRKK